MDYNGEASISDDISEDERAEIESALYAAIHYDVNTDTILGDTTPSAKVQVVAVPSCGAVQSCYNFPNDTKTSLDNKVNASRDFNDEDSVVAAKVSKGFHHGMEISAENSFLKKNCKKRKSLKKESTSSISEHKNRTKIHRKLMESDETTYSAPPCKKKAIEHPAVIKNNGTTLSNRQTVNCELAEISSKHSKVIGAMTAKFVKADNNIEELFVVESNSNKRKTCSNDLVVKRKKLKKDKKVKEVNTDNITVETQCYGARDAIKHPIKKTKINGKGVSNGQCLSKVDKVTTQISGTCGEKMIGEDQMANCKIEIENCQKKKKNRSKGNGNAGVDKEHTPARMVTENLVKNKKISLDEEGVLVQKKRTDLQRNQTGACKQSIDTLLANGIHPLGKEKMRKRKQDKNGNWSGLKRDIVEVSPDDVNDEEELMENKNFLSFKGIDKVAMNGFLKTTQQAGQGLNGLRNGAVIASDFSTVSQSLFVIDKTPFKQSDNVMNAFLMWPVSIGTSQLQNNVGNLASLMTPADCGERPAPELSPVPSTSRAFTSSSRSRLRSPPIHNTPTNGKKTANGSTRSSKNNDKLVHLRNVITVSSDFSESIDSGDSDPGAIVISSSSDTDSTDDCSIQETGSHELLTNVRLPPMKSRCTPEEYLKQILRSLGGTDGDWKINDADLKHSRNRYYTKRAPRCLKCREFGHVKQECTAPPKVIKCLQCGRPNHIAVHCPWKQCWRCLQFGHDARRCTQKANHRGSVCSRCGLLGHREELCPERWRQFHATTDPFNFKKPDEDMIRPIRKTCCNCGQTGHLDRECDRKPMDQLFTKISCVVKKYLPENEMRALGIGTTGQGYGSSKRDKLRTGELPQTSRRRSLPKNPIPAHEDYQKRHFYSQKSSRGKAITPKSNNGKGQTTNQPHRQTGSRVSQAQQDVLFYGQETYVRNGARFRNRSAGGKWNPSGFKHHRSKTN